MNLRFLNFYTITGALFFLYVLARAITVGVTYDEAWTLMDFVPISVEHILSCNPCDANNHILNTLLIKWLYLFTPDTLFWARVPNVLAFLLYIIVGHKIGKKYLPQPFGQLFFLLMLANPFLLDFFSLARGYGLSIGLMMASVLVLLQFRDSLSWKQGVAALGLASLAVLANFALLNFWFGAFFVLHFFALKEGFNKALTMKLLYGSLLMSLVLLAIMYEPVRKLLIQDGFYFGGKMGFYQETINTLTRYSLYDPDSATMSKWVSGILTSILAISVFLGLRGFSSFKAFAFSKATLISCLVGIPILSNIMQYVLLDTLYLIARTALFYFPLLVALLLFWMAETQKPIYTAINIGFGVLIAMAFTGNLLWVGGFKKTITWEFDAYNKEILTNLQMQAQAENETYTIGAVRLYIRGILYQIDDFPNLRYIPEQNVKDSVTTDYYIFYNKDLPRIGYFGRDKNILKYEMDTVMKFPGEGIYVFSNFKKKETN